MFQRWSLAGLFLFAASGFVAAADLGWPQWRGPNRDAKSEEKGINTNWDAKKPELLWIAEGFGKGFASVAIKEDRIFTTGDFENGQCAVCYDTKKKEVVWKTPITTEKFKHGYDGSRCTPALDGNFLYAESSNGGIACLKQATGEVVWSKSFKEWDAGKLPQWGYGESPLVDDKWVLCTPGTKTAMIVALDKLTGKEVWRSVPPGDLGSKGRDGDAYSSIVISNGGGVKQYVQLVGRGVIGVRASDGKFLWNYNRVTNNTAAIPTCIPSGDFIFTSSGYGDGGAALLKLTSDGEGVKAEEVYYHSAKEFQNHHGGMILHEGKIYCGHGHNNGFPACLELETGKIIWGTDKRGEGSRSASVMYIDGHLIFRYESGKVVLVEASPAGYKIKGSFDPAFKEAECWAHPVVVNKKLYLREQNKLMCYDLAQ